MCLDIDYNCFEKEEEDDDDSEVESESFDEKVKNEERRLRKACNDGNFEEVKKILSSSRALATQLLLFTLSIAVESKNDKLASFLLIYAEEQRIERELAYEAPKRGNIEVMEMILKRGWDINITRCLLQASIREGQEGMVELLLRRGAIINEEMHQQPINMACEKGHLSIIQLLVKNGANISGKKGGVSTPLIQAITYDKVEVVKYLIAQGASIEAKDGNDCDAFYYAACKGNFEIASLLVAAGASVHNSYSLRFVPFMAACKSSLEVSIYILCVACL